MDFHDILQLPTQHLLLTRNELLVAKGSIHTHVYVVVSGSLKAYVIHEGQEHIIRFGYPGDLMVAMDSFLTDKPTEFYIEAIKKTEVRVISKSAITGYIYQSAEHMKSWIQELEKLVLQQMERERDLLISSPAERYSRVLQRSPRLFQEIPHRYIANYLRMSPETLSRLKKS